MGYIDLPVVGGGGSGITDLTGDVTATGPGSAAATVVQVGGETAADVATSVQDTQAATELATPDTLVKRGNTGNANFENVIGNTSLQAIDGVTPKFTIINKDNLQITSTPDNRLITLDVTNNLINIQDTFTADVTQLTTTTISASNSFSEYAAMSAGFLTLKKDTMTNDGIVIDTINSGRTNFTGLNPSANNYVFNFESSNTYPAQLKTNWITLRDNMSNEITIAPPNGLSPYSLTLPSAAPMTGSALTVDSIGVSSFTEVTDQANANSIVSRDAFGKSSFYEVEAVTFESNDGANLSATMDYTNGVQITNSGTANSILTSNSLNINDGASSAILAATSVSFIANGGNTAASLDAIAPAVNVESAVSNFRSTLSSGVLELYSDKNTPFYLSINGTTTDQATFTLVGTGVLDPYFYFNSSNNPNVFVQTGSFKADLAIGTNAVLNHTNLIFSDTSAGTNSTISFTTPNLYLTTSNGEVVVTANDLSIDTAGKGLKIKEGTDAKMGVATLTAGTVTVATQAVTANSRIFLTVQSLGTITTPVAVAVTARTANTDFTITSADNTDTSDVAWMIVEPA